MGLDISEDYMGLVVLEKAMAPHSSTLAWKIPWTEEPWDREESDTTERLYFHFSLSCIGEGNGNPLASIIPGTAEPGGLPSMGSQSRTRPKRLSSSSNQGAPGGVREGGAGGLGIRRRALDVLAQRFLYVFSSSRRFHLC